MMRCCSLLIALVFCIDHVACLEAPGVQNLSSIFNNKPSKNWVVLVAGSDDWINYRHQDVNPDIFAKVLKGDKKLEKEGKKILKSGPDDNVFIYYTGHGASQAISFPSGYLHAVELNDILGSMYLNKRYNKLVLYVDSCSAGSLFRDLLPSDVGIFVTTSANEDEQSWSSFCNDKRIGVCLATEYSYGWITDSEYKDLKKRTLDQQYEEVKKRTKKSHVMKYGEMPNVEDRIPSSRVHLFSLSRGLMEATTEEEHEAAWRKLHRVLQLDHIVKETFHDIVMDVTSHHKPTLKVLPKRDEFMCFKELFDQFQTHCFTIQQVPELARYTPHLMELCKAGYETATLIESVHSVCS